MAEECPDVCRELDPPEEALFEAVRKNDLDAAIMMLAEADVNVNKTHTYKTALYLAMERENIPMVKTLIEHGADVDLPSYCNAYATYETPIVTAARLERIDLIELLLDHGCKLEGAQSCYEGKSALQWATSYGNLSMAKLLLKRGADIDWIGVYMHTTLHYATIADKPDTVKWLLENGAEVSLNGDSRSALHIAAARGNFTIVKLLLTYKCEPDIKDNFGFTPFSLACLRGYLSVVQLFFEMCGHTRFDINDGLRRAAETGHVEVIKCLLEHGANVNCLNSLGESPLSLAARGQRAAVDLLLEQGANLNIVDKRGYTPLQLGLLREQVDICCLLIQHGALLSTWNTNTDSPLQIAFSISNPLLVKLIIQAGCRTSSAKWFTSAGITEKIREVDFFESRRALPYGVYNYRDRDLQKEIWQWALNTTAQVRSLRELTRVAIRDSLVIATRGASILKRLRALPLPPALRKFLTLEDILWE